MGNSKGITMMALIVTVLLLLILAGVSVISAIGNNGIVTQSAKAAKEAMINNDKEQILVSFNDAKRDKLVKDDYSNITIGDLQKKFTKAGIDATFKDTIGDSIIITFERSGRSYLVDQDGNVTVAPEGGATGNGDLSIGSGTADDPYLVQSVEDLVTLSRKTKSGNINQNTYIKLTIDINFAYPWSYIDAEHNSLNYDVNGDGAKQSMIEELGYEKGFEPIGTSSAPFKGHFNGNGKTITKLRVANRGNGAGLFGVVENGSVENINIVEANIDCPNSQSDGILIGEYRYTVPITISNCNLQGSVKAKSGSNIAGLIGKLVDNSAAGTTFTISDCTVDARVVNQQQYNAIVVGGATLKTSSTINFSNTSTRGVVSVSGNNNHAGFIGYADKGTINFTDCRNRASVTSTSSSDNMAGFGNFGACTVNIHNCVNQGPITAINGNNTAGFISTCTGTHNITNSINDGSVSGGTNVGGFLGNSGGNGGTISVCKNATTVKGYDKVGGIIGNDKKTVLTDCYNTGYINCNEGIAGGIIGYSSTNSSIEGAINSGIVSSKKASGIIGEEQNLTKCKYTYNLGSLSGTERTAAILYQSSTTYTVITYCYYLEDTAETWNGSQKNRATNNIDVLERDDMSDKLSEFIASHSTNWEESASRTINLKNLPTVDK